LGAITTTQLKSRSPSVLQLPQRLLNDLMLVVLGFTATIWA
jgi:hypothetical protein